MLLEMDKVEFEGCSYGFRPGRSAHDAIKHIHMLSLPTSRRKWVLDADIKGAFDNIDHDYLMTTLGTVPGRELIRQWLKAGVMDRQQYQPTEQGTPQGGVISPLLLNVALHGMEAALGIRYYTSGRAYPHQRAVVRYADDFVVYCATREDAEHCKQILSGWLADRGLALSPEKTRIVHLNEGYDFLGFTVRLYPSPQTTRTGWKLLIKPSKQSVKRLKQRLRDIWKNNLHSPPEAITRHMNPIIRGWANYFRVSVAKRTFSHLDRWMYERAKRYTKRRHPTKTYAWCKRRYFGKLHPQRNDRWVFGSLVKGNYLLKFSWTPIQYHIKVKGRASPDDPALQTYWYMRQKKLHRELKPSQQRMAIQQKGQCPHCRTSLFNGEILEVHHVKPRSQGGLDSYDNLRLVHLTCHHQLTTHMRRNPV
jgi:RNA-directed DNA polymerase